MYKKKQKKRNTQIVEGRLTRRNFPANIWASESMQSHYHLSSPQLIFRLSLKDCGAGL